MREVIELVDLETLKPDPRQPRKEFDQKKIKELAKSLVAKEMIEPIEVDEENRIRRGERRWRAAKEKGLDKVPIRRKTGLTEKEWLERQLIDDAHREDLTPVERFWAYTTGIYNINTDSNLTVDDIQDLYYENYEGLLNAVYPPKTEEGDYDKGGASALAKIVGLDHYTITGYMSVFKVGKELQSAFLNGEIPYTYLESVARIQDPEEQEEAEKILLEDLEKERENRIFKAPIEVREYATKINQNEPVQPEEKIVEVSREVREQLKRDPEFQREVLEHLKQDPEYPPEQDFTEDELMYPDVDVDTQIRDYVKREVEAARKVVANGEGDWKEWNTQDKMEFVLGFIERHNLSCPKCGAKGIMWECGHSFEG